MRVAYITNSAGRSGVGYRALEIKKHIRASQAGVKLAEFHLDGKRGLLSQEGRPIDWISTRGAVGKIKSISWVRLGRQLSRYLAKLERRPYDLYHMTNQSLSFLARGNQPAVITVHDIIEVTNPQSRGAKMLNRYLLSGIRRAAHVIAVSNYTANEVKKYYQWPDSKLTVVHNGVGEEWEPINCYRSTVAYHARKKKWKLDETTRIILFVGSDHPRKNAAAAIEVLSQLIKKYPRTVLLKVGEAGLPAEREKLLRRIDAMGVREHVRFVGGIANEELNELYNLSDVLLYPSTNEGFGLPLVQAMAAGLPVVTVRATAIPEVVGNAAVMVEPDDITAMVKGVLAMVENEGARNRLIASGKKRAAAFSWQRSAQQVVEVYRQVWKSYYAMSP